MKKSVKAMYSLGVIYDNLENIEGAIEWYEKAAMKDSVKAMYSLGVIYDNLGNTEEAMKGYEKAATKGYVKAMYSLGVIYDSLDNIQKAMKWYEKAAMKGCVKSQTNLGLCYLDETNEYEKAFKWLIKSVKHKDVFALSALGKIYNKGLGVPKDFDKALKFYKRAAKLGYCKGQFVTGHLYGTVFNNLNKAVYWFSKAANNTSLLIEGTMISKKEQDKFKFLAQLNLNNINKTLLPTSNSNAPMILEECTFLAKKLLEINYPIKDKSSFLISSNFCINRKD